MHAPQQSAALTQIESSRAVQEVQAAMVIAKKFPRDERAALDRILNDCADQDLADAAVYQYARGGTDISGPSIRLAEAIARRWGNVQFEVRELGRAKGEDGVGTSEVMAYCWDQESNTRRNSTFTVRHWRDTKQGGYALKDERDIYELCANQGARRLRACILGVIPGNITSAALAQCETTMSANADTSPEAQKKIVESFAKFGVKKEQIEARIQRRLDSITPAQVVALRKIMASLKDGMSKPDEWFPVNAAPPVPDISAKEKPAKKPAQPPSAAREFWNYCESKKYDAAKVTALLVQYGHIASPDDELTDEEAGKVNKAELDTDLF